jgi:peptidoglycan-associated lipoprotein
MRDALRWPLTVVGLGLATILLTGCPKRPVLAPTAGTGSTGATAGQAGATAGQAGTTAGQSSATTGQRSTVPGYTSTPALRDVHFDFDRATIRPEDQKILDANAQWLQANPGAQLLIEGHADERGTSAHNMALGERRAQATRDALVARQVSPARISIKTHGGQRPVCTEQTDPCWAKNRRAHFLVKL